MLMALLLLRLWWRILMYVQLRVVWAQLRLLLTMLLLSMAV